MQPPPPTTTTTAKPITAAAARNPKHVKHKRRYCRVEGCTRIIKSQGVCQRHGAKPTLCKVEGCRRQAQGNFDRMCKAHFKAMKRITTPIPKVDSTDPPPAPEGSSVYDNVLPLSISYIPSTETVNPLVAHLKTGFDAQKPPAWHRNEERRARGLIPIENPASQLEAWERELVWMETLVLTGAPDVSFRHFARGWGRDKGFHMVLGQFICERQGDVRRKERQRVMKPEKKRTPKKQEGIGKNTYSSAETPVAADIFGAFDDFGNDEENAFADDVFNFTVEEFEVVTSQWNDTYTGVSYGSSSSAGTPEEPSPLPIEVMPEAFSVADLSSSQEDLLPPRQSQAFAPNFHLALHPPPQLEGDQLHF
eukprot:CAMPEP_0113632530 /NCGR_PEP_ID=MMETSP0017_2-20120614/16911_1 /TAXON_ID=2856 /ORGANISM="Cylindrotheca closterium" /LENGTH=363 /DNA_ID=CAMNT_0000543095 /DNA_START=141 /DNA_END=1229 /DNA_ORIENTATION=- /assembly_acc=CAM_ASM_000147